MQESQATDMADSPSQNKLKLPTNVVGEKEVIVDGPLSLAYCNALNEIYKKEVDPETGMAVETQQIDELERKRLWLLYKLSVSEGSEETVPVGMIYAVRDGQVDSGVVFEVTDTLGKMSPSELNNTCVVIESTGANNPMCEALKKLVKNKHVSIVSNLEQALETLNAK
jgi:hypothetical protein